MPKDYPIRQLKAIGEVAGRYTVFSFAMVAFLVSYDSIRPHTDPYSVTLYAIIALLWVVWPMGRLLLREE